MFLAVFGFYGFVLVKLFQKFRLCGRTLRMAPKASMPAPNMTQVPDSGTGS